MRACSVLTLVVVLLGVKAGDSFKDQEFKTCDMNPFCKRCAPFHGGWLV
jgi:hypothetical protein